MLTLSLCCLPENLTCPCCLGSIGRIVAAGQETDSPPALAAAPRAATFGGSPKPTNGAGADDLCELGTSIYGPTAPPMRHAREQDAMLANGEPSPAAPSRGLAVEMPRDLDIANDDRDAVVEKDLREIFTMADVDGGGTIEPLEFGIAMEHIGIQLDTEGLEMLFAHIDVNSAWQLEPACGCACACSPPLLARALQLIGWSRVYLTARQATGTSTWTSGRR